LWRYGVERGALWRKVIDAKYGSMWGGWCSDIVRGSYGVTLWKNIRKDWPSFSKALSFEVGDGAKVHFWHDRWCGALCLKEAFPEFFSISRNQATSMADILSFRHGVLHWDLSFSRHMQDWELESVASFMELIYSLSLSGLGDDKPCWGAGVCKFFTVKEYYRFLNSPSSWVFPWKSIWKAKVPPRVAFFSWTTALEKILTVAFFSFWWSDVVCASKAAKVSITCCCIALMCRSFSPWFLAFLGSIGLCLIVFRLFLSAGKGVSRITVVLGFGV
jgi:hypothetical protein